MSILFLVQKEQRVILDRLYESVGRHLGECDFRWRDSDEQANLKRYFRDKVTSSLAAVIRLMRSMLSVPAQMIPIPRHMDDMPSHQQ